MNRASIDRPLLENPSVPTLPAFLRVEHGMPWGHWIRFDEGSLIFGTRPGLGLTLVDDSLAPEHAALHHVGEALLLEVLHEGAELRVDGVPKRLAHLDEPCTLSLGQTHLQVLPPPRTVTACSGVLQVLRGWLETDPETGLPSATHLETVLDEGCPGPSGDCRQALLLIRPQPLDRRAARTLRRALPPDTLLCRAGPEHLAAWLPEGAPARLELPSTWRVAMRDCAHTRHRPETLLARTREALEPGPIDSELSADFEWTEVPRA